MIPEGYLPDQPDYWEWWQDAPVEKAGTYPRVFCRVCFSYDCGAPKK